MTEDTRTYASQPTYVEHLRAPLWCWAVFLILTLALSFAMYVPLGPIAGLCTLIVGVGFTTVLLVGTAVTIRVTDDELWVGSAHIPWGVTGLVATLDASATTKARTIEADPRAFAVMRPLATRESVTVEVIDDEDPHPYWLVSTQDPAALGQAIARAQRSHLARH